MYKNKWTFLAYLSASIITITSVGLGSYFIYKAITQEKHKEWEYKKLGTPKTIWFNNKKLDKGKEPNKMWDFQIKVYPYEDGSFWLDDDGLIKLKDKLHEKLYHGQEITTLDDIVFGNVNMIGEGSNGLYFPLTKEIFLNIEGWRNHNNLSVDDKIDGMMSTITHEYGHHISNMYLSTSRSSNSWKGDGENALLVKGLPAPTYWNPKFTENFYRQFNYDDKTLLNDSKGIKVDESYINNGYKESVALDISLNQLFWSANGNKRINYNENDVIFGLPGQETKKNKGKSYKNMHVPVHYNNKFIKYRYSLDEIITRQLAQMMHIYDIPSKKELFLHMIRVEGSNSIDSFVADANTSSQFFFNDSVQGEKYISNNFYKDSVFGNTSRTEDIYNNFRDAMGYHKMISNIYALNESYAFVDKDNGNKYAEHELGKYNKDKIQLTGWTPKDVKGIYYGSKNTQKKYVSNDVLRFGDENERKNLWYFDRKDATFSQKRIDSKPFDKWLPFATNVYIDALYKHGNDYQFKWWKDLNGDDKPEINELFSTNEILKDSSNSPNDVINNMISKVSSFKQTWSEDDSYPSISYKKGDLWIEYLH